MIAVRRAAWFGSISLRMALAMRVSSLIRTAAAVSSSDGRELRRGRVGTHAREDADELLLRLLGELVAARQPLLILRGLGLEHGDALVELLLDVGQHLLLPGEPRIGRGIGDVDAVLLRRAASRLRRRARVSRGRSVDR